MQLIYGTGLLTSFQSESMANLTPLEEVFSNEGGWFVSGTTAYHAFFSVTSRDLAS